jgi:iron complex transport system substrate-binding protein
MIRRLVTPLVVTVLVLAGCAQSAGPSEAPATSAPTATASAPASTAPSAEPSEAAACREVQHALGTSCIPADPQRVVTLGYQTSLEYALALGLPVVGFDGDATAPGNVPKYLDPALVSGATFVGDGSAPDLEQVKALDPDLIIYTYDNGNYPQVSEIAPTVVLSVGYTSYRDDFLAAAELLGRTDEAQAFLSQLDARIADVREAVAPTIDGKTVSVFRTVSDGKATIAGEPDYIAELFSEIGAVRPADQKNGYQEIGLEQIGLLDADVAFPAFGFASTTPESLEAIEATRKQFQESPLWSTLKFVQDDQLYPIDPLVYGLHGIYWAYGMLDEIEKTVAAG